MCDVHRLRGHAPAYRVTFADRVHSNIRYTSAGWQADRWRDGVLEIAPRTGYASLTEAIDAVRPEPTMRTTHDPEANILLGKTLEEAREEAARLAAKALTISDHLAHCHYAASSVVRLNLENERNGLEWEAAGIEARIAEYTGQIPHVRYPVRPVATGRLAAFGQTYRYLRTGAR